MAMKTALLDAKLAAINIGLESFPRSVREAGGTAVHVHWQPPGDGEPALAWQLAMLAGDDADPDCIGSRIDRANARAIERLLSAQPVWTDVALHAREIWPDMGRTLLHAGAPVPWSRMCGPMQGAMTGAVLYEGWADSHDAARSMLDRGEIDFGQCHDFAAVGPMAGIISPSMPLLVVKNAVHGNIAYTNINEGIGRVLRFGACGAEVIERLRWMERVLAPALRIAVRAAGGIDLKAIQAQALLMGDEVHSRNAAATAQLFQAIAVALAASEAERGAMREVLRFIAETSQFFLNFSMASAKAIMDAAHGIEASSLVTAIARNGVTTGIRIGGLGSQWFEAPSDTPQGLYFAGFTSEDANPDLGDSAIAETAGFGGFSLAASPALVQLVGGSVAQAVSYSKQMLHVTLARNPAMALPLLDFAGAPSGIDVRKVIDTGIRPVLTTGIAHRQAGLGQIGAGIVRVPLECFSGALRALALKLGVR